MVNVSKVYEVQVFESDDSTLDFTISESRLLGPVQVGRPVIRPLQGRTETRGWNFLVDDAGDWFTAKIADAGGRAILIGRLVRARVNINGAGFTTLGTARIVEISDLDGISYNVSTEDERARASRITLWDEAFMDGTTDLATNTTMLWPSGLNTEYGNWSPFPRTRVNLQSSNLQKRDNLVLVRPDLVNRPDVVDPGFQVAVGFFLTGAAARVMQEDLKTGAKVLRTATEGNFRHLRMAIKLQGQAIADFEISTFDTTKLGQPGGTTVEPAETFIEALANFETDPFNDFNPALEGAWVVMPAFSPGVDVIEQAYIYAPTMPPSEDAPVHIGGASGIHPHAFLEKIWNHVGRRFDQASIDALKADDRYETGTWRVTGAHAEDRFTEDHLLGPYSVTAFMLPDGTLAPKSTALPQDVDPGTLPTLDVSKVQRPKLPSFKLGGRDVITSIIVKYTNEIQGRAGSDLGSADQIRVQELSVTRDHDRIADLGRRSLTFILSGIHRLTVIFRDPFTGEIRVFPGVDWFAEFLANEVFQRWGDGPQEGELEGVENDATVSGIEPGDLFLLDFATYPTLQTASRGGASRLVQATVRTDLDFGLGISFLDVGPGLQPLATPTVTVVQSATKPKHEIDVTVANLGSGVGFQLSYAIADSEPAPGSSLWRIGPSGSEDGGGGGTASIGSLPSGRTIFVRAFAREQGRTRSAWSTADSVATEALAAVTGLMADVINGIRTDLDWTNGEAAYPVMVLLDQSACASATPSEIARLDVGTTEYTIDLLQPSLVYCAAVRHFDAFGGIGPEVTVEFTSGTVVPVAPRLAGLIPIQGIDPT